MGNTGLGQKYEFNSHLFDFGLLPLAKKFQIHCKLGVDLSFCKTDKFPFFLPGRLRAPHVCAQRISTTRPKAFLGISLSFIITKGIKIMAWPLLKPSVWTGSVVI